MKKIFLSLVMFLWSGFFIATPVFAGSCQCTQGNNVDCYANLNNALSCNKIQADTAGLKDLISKRTIGGDTTPYSSCVYVPDGSTCGFANGANGTVRWTIQDTSKYAVTPITCGNPPDVCTSIDKPCSQDSDCDQYGGGPQVGPATCNLGYCFLGQVRFQRYQTQPDILGIKADLPLSKPLLEIRIPGLSFSDIQNTLDKEGYIHIPFLGEYLTAIYRFGMVAASILAVVLLIAQGAKVMTSAGGEDKNEAYHRITQIISGLILLWGSYAILYAVNPALVTFSALKVKFIEPIPLSLRETGENEAGGAAGPQARARGKGDVDAADAAQCPNLQAGQNFIGAFTTYYSLTSKDYGNPGEYAGIYRGNDPSLQGKGDFFCAVAMECGCPNDRKLNERTCQNSSGSAAWRPCAYFDSSVPYCQHPAAKYIPGGSVAASTCFPKGCRLLVNGHELKVTDRGSGIIGTHFDLYLGAKGDGDFVNDTSWLSTNVQVIDCSGTIDPQKRSRLQKKYNAYKPGVCKPGYNC